MSLEKNIFFLLCFILVCFKGFGFGLGKRISSFYFVISWYVVKYLDLVQGRDYFVVSWYVVKDLDLVLGREYFLFSFVVSQYVVKEHNEALKSPLGVQPTLLVFIIFLLF